MSNLIKIYNSLELNKVINDLLLNLFSQKIDNKDYIVINKEELRKAIWLASILANSSDNEHRQKVQQLSSLIYLNYPEEAELSKVCYILYSRVGNLTATKFLKSIFQKYSDNPVEQLSILNEDVILENELINKRQSNILQIEDKAYLTTDFQKVLWNNLVIKNNISVSAPTSSGKSFILKKYIENQFNLNQKYCVFYIVPSRALINQVSEELRIDLINVEIKTAYIENEENLFSKIVYILTPERAIKIINLNTDTINPNIIFIDEIQGVEDEQGRGNLFEYVFSEFARLFPNTKIITAGPNISNPNILFKELFNKESEISSTELSPVFQLKTVLSLNEKSIEFKIYTNQNTTQTIIKDIKFDKNLKKLYDGNRGAGLSIIIKEVITNNNESNLVYASKSNLAESWALKYSESITQEEVKQEIKDLIEYLKEDIHPRYILIKCLIKGVAFHHSKLSELARKEIEVLFQKGFIKTLFCTSTLLEGVNMPANNLFILKPEKNTLKLSNFEFGNLIGRAGRIKDSLYGSIYCITIDNEKWAQDYYESSYSKEVQTSSSKSIKDLDNDDLKKSVLNIKELRIRSLIITLRHKYLKGDLNLETFLLKKCLDEDKIEQIESDISKSLKDIKIPYNILKLNPTIDPLLQNELFETIKRDGITKWVININSRFAEGYKRDVAEKINYEDNSFYWQLDSLITRLDQIFNITKDLYFKDSLSVGVSTICQNSVSWIDGKSIGELIAKRINYLSKDDRVLEDKRIDANNDNHINTVIRDVININSKAITYSLLRYIKLLSDILDNVLTETEKEKFKFSLSLPTFLELGSKEPIIIKLITSGMPRSIALKVFDKFKLTNQYKEGIDVFLWLKNKDSVDGLKLIYNKYLRRQKFLKQLGNN